MKIINTSIPKKKKIKLEFQKITNQTKLQEKPFMLANGSHVALYLTLSYDLIF